MLRVGVNRAQLRTGDPGLGAAVHRVRAAPAAPDDLDRDVQRLDDLRDLVVLRRLRRNDLLHRLLLRALGLLAGQRLAYNRFDHVYPIPRESDGGADGPMAI